ncbi:hypothetical protein ACQ4PT_070562 [Festuca glaucescens]
MARSGAAVAIPGIGLPQAAAVASCNDLFLHLPINYGCSLLSRKTPSYRHGYDGVVLPGAGASSTGSTNLVASADGTAAWLFRAHTESTLVDLLTGTLTRLPRLPTDAKMNRWMEKWRGIVYGDGTVFIYNIVLEEHRFFDFENTSTFIVAILRTGDAAWKLVKKRLDWKTGSHLSVVYHDRKILACEGGRFGLLLDLDFGSNDDDRGGGWISWRSVWDSSVETQYNQGNYVFELHGNLMRATVLVEEKYWRRGCSGDDPTFALSVVVHAMEGLDGNGKMRWAVRDGQSLVDHVLFLGSPASFAADAAHLGVDGGCAYFVFRSRVFKHNLIDGESQLMERLRPWWGSHMALWLQPRPAIAPVHKVLLEATIET